MKGFPENMTLPVENRTLLFEEVDESWISSSTDCAIVWGHFESKLFFQPSVH